jgi:uncharacterized membrane protein YcaP (DUF421 family)
MDLAWTTMNSAISDLLGLRVAPTDLTLMQMMLRATLVFVWGIIIVRLGDRRLLGRNAGFDMLLVVILGSVLSRAINGQSAFFPTLGVSGFLVLLHHLVAWLASRSDRFSKWVKGLPQLLVVDGEVREKELKRSRFTTEDLEENLRLNGNVGSVRQVRCARLERNGSVSVVRREP